MDWGSIIIAILGGGIIASGITVFANRRDTTANTYQKLSETVGNLSDDLSEERSARRSDKVFFEAELVKLKQVNKDLEYSLRVLWDGNRENVLQLRELKQKPRFEPPGLFFRGSDKE